MPDDYHAIEAKEKTKRHGMTMRAWVAIAGTAGLGVGGLTTFLLSPKPVTEQQMEAMLKPIKEELSSHDLRISEAKYNADRANRDNELLRLKLDKDLAKLDKVMDGVSDIRESVARIDERTKKVGVN